MSVIILKHLLKIKLIWFINNFQQILYCKKNISNKQSTNKYKEKIFLHFLLFDVKISIYLIIFNIKKMDILIKY